MCVRSAGELHFPRLGVVVTRGVVGVVAWAVFVSVGSLLVPTAAVGAASAEMPSAVMAAGSDAVALSGPVAPRGLEHVPMIHGRVELADGAAVVGAKLTIRDRQGRDVTYALTGVRAPSKCRANSSSPRCTHHGGMFSLPLTGKLPGVYVIESSGGFIHGVRTSVRLSIRYDRGGGESRGHWITLATTVEDMLRARGISAGRAVLMTKKSLGMPEAANLGVDLQASDAYLSGPRLVATAGSQGGLNDAIANTVRAAKHGTLSPWVRQTQKVRATQAREGFLTELLASAGAPEWLEGVLGMAAGPTANFVLAKVGLDSNVNSLEAIQADLKEIKSQLADLSMAVTDLKKDVDAGFFQAKLMATCVEDRTRAFTTWTSMAPYVSKLQTALENLGIVANYGTNPTPVSLADASSAWRAFNQEADALFGGDMQIIMSQLTGSDGPSTGSNSGFVSSSVTAYSSCAHSSGKIFLNAGETADYAAVFEWAAGLAVAAKVVRDNYLSSGTYRCLPVGTTAGLVSDFCPEGQQAYVSQVSPPPVLGTLPANTSGSAPRDVFFALMHFFPSAVPSGVSVDLRNGRAWSTRSVSNAQSISGDPSSDPATPNIVWRFPSVAEAQALLPEVPAGTQPADWLNAQSAGAFDSVQGFINRLMGTPFMAGSIYAPGGARVGGSALRVPWAGSGGVPAFGDYYVTPPGDGINTPFSSMYIYPPTRVESTAAQGIVTSETRSTIGCPESGLEGDGTCIHFVGDTQQVDPNAFPLNGSGRPVQGRAMVMLDSTQSSFGDYPWSGNLRYGAWQAFFLQGDVFGGGASWSVLRDPVFPAASWSGGGLGPDGPAYPSPMVMDTSAGAQPWFATLPTDWYTYTKQWVALPDFVGSDFTQAQSFLMQIGVPYELILAPNDGSYEAGQVSETIPKAGTWLDPYKGQKVSVTYVDEYHLPDPPSCEGPYIGQLGPDANRCP